MGAGQGRIEVRHTVVKPHLVMLVKIRMRFFGRGGQVLGMRSQRLVVCHYHAASTAGDGFVAVEAVDAEAAEAAGLPPMQGAAQGFGGIFDKGDIALAANFGDLIDAAGVSECVHGNAGRYPAAGIFVPAHASGLFGPGV